MLEAERSLEPLLDWAEGVTYEDFPADAIAHARVILLDQLASLWAGRHEREVLGIARWLQRRGTIDDPLWLGLVLGVAVVAQELDEGHRESMGHPGSHVVPTILARLHENPETTMRDALTALIIGYEVAARIASAGRPRPGSHPHGTWGTMGAAVARARLTGGQGHLREAVYLAAGTGLATAFSAPLAGRTVRNLYAGLSTFLGMLANEWNADVTGIFSPTETLFHDWDGADIAKGLGARFAITRNYFKTIAACRYVHGVIEAVEQIGEGRRLNRTDIERVTVETYAPASVLTGAPFNTLSSKFSIPYAVLCAVDGRAREAKAFHEPLELSAMDRAWLAKVNVLESEEMTQQLPHVRAVRVTVAFADGSECATRVSLPRGEWDRPHRSEALAQKWATLLGDYPGDLPGDPANLTSADLRRFVKILMEELLSTTTP